MSKLKRVRRRYCSHDKDHERHLWWEDKEPYWCEGITYGKDNPRTLIPQQWVVSSA